MAKHVLDTGALRASLAGWFPEVIGIRIPVLPLKFSRVFDTIFEQERSIRQMMEEDALALYTYREGAAQFDNLLSYLEQHYA